MKFKVEIYWKSSTIVFVESETREDAEAAAVDKAGQMGIDYFIVTDFVEPAKKEVKEK